MLRNSLNVNVIELANRNTGEIPAILKRSIKKEKQYLIGLAKQRERV